MVLFNLHPLSLLNGSPISGNSFLLYFPPINSHCVVLLVISNSVLFFPLYLVGEWIFSLKQKRSFHKVCILAQAAIARFGDLVSNPNLEEQPWYSQKSFSNCSKKFIFPFLLIKCYFVILGIIMLELPKSEIIFPCQESQFGFDCPHKWLLGLLCSNCHLGFMLAATARWPKLSWGYHAVLAWLLCLNWCSSALIVLFMLSDFTCIAPFPWGGAIIDRCLSSLNVPVDIDCEQHWLVVTWPLLHWYRLSDAKDVLLHDLLRVKSNLKWAYFNIHDFVGKKMKLRTGRRIQNYYGRVCRICGKQVLGFNGWKFGCLAGGMQKQPASLTPKLGYHAAY